MRRMPPVFIRQPDGQRLATDQVTPGCEWVLAGEGVPTEKFDGTCCMITGGKLYRRFDAKSWRGMPPGFIEASPKTEYHHMGWLPVGPENPADKYHLEAWFALPDEEKLMAGATTWELVGPKIQSNPYRLERHELWPHFIGEDDAYPLGSELTFDGLRRELEWQSIEGLVFHHPDGRMAKVKRSDFGIPWPPEDGLE